MEPMSIYILKMKLRSATRSLLCYEECIKVAGHCACNYMFSATCLTLAKRVHKAIFVWWHLMNSPLLGHNVSFPLTLAVIQ